MKQENKEYFSDSEVEHFDRMAEDYKKTHDDALRLAGGDSDYFYHAKIRLIRERITGEPKRILDFGCGTGRLTKLLSDSFSTSEIFGIDPSEASIKAARKGLGGQVGVTFDTSLKSIGADYDLVVSAGVFHHIPPKAWGENAVLVAGAMKSGARAFVFEHNALSPATRYLLWRAGNDRDATLVFPWRMKAVMSRAGLKEVRAEFISFFPSSSGPLLRLEPFLTWLPLGAQYMVSARKA